MPDFSAGVPCRTLLIIGNAGSAMWRRFSSSPEFHRGNNPLNDFSRRVIDSLAETFGAIALYPFPGPPFLPFIAWAQRAEPVWPSPIGPLIHPEYGLWHAYRGALGLPESIALPARPLAERPCDSCIDKPCLHTCPVEAFDGKSYDVPACVAHISEPRGEACFAAGCLARRACPVGAAYAYAPAQAAFHTRAFLRANAAGEKFYVPDDANSDKP